jgi:hypothetical protein
MIKLHDQIVRGLERLGYRRGPFNRRRQSERYTVFENFRGGYIFIGKAGAVRGGRNISESIPLDRLKTEALAAGLSENWPPKEATT